MGDLSKNFSAWEFECPCCGRSDMHPGTIERLQKLRDDPKWEKSLNIIPGGGFRCREYDKSNGAHPLGQAVDPKYARRDHALLVSLAYEYGFTGVGDKNVGGRYQLHMDDSSHDPGVRTRPYKWTYQ